MATVPVLQVNPYTDESELCSVELGDLDDFLEDISPDYDLSEVELGSFFGKLAKAVKKVGKTVGRGALAVGTGGASELVINRKKIAKGLGKVGRVVGRGALAVGTGGASELIINRKKLAKGLAKVGRGALAVGTGGASEAVIRLGQRKRLPAGKAQKVVKRVAALKAAGKVAHKLPRVQLSRPALVHKAAAKHAAQAVTELAPVLTPRAAATIGAAVTGTPLRPTKMRKPVARKMAKSKARGKQPAIVARAKSHSPEKGELKARYAKRKQANKSRALGSVQFNLTVRGLLGQLDKQNTSPAIASSLRRLRLVTGVGNAQ